MFQLQYLFVLLYLTPLLYVFWPDQFFFQLQLVCSEKNLCLLRRWVFTMLDAAIVNSKTT